MTDREREGLIRSSTAESLNTWILFALTRVGKLEAALFSYLLLADGVAPDEARQRAAQAVSAVPGVSLTTLAAELLERGISSDDWGDRLTALGQEREWLTRKAGLETHPAVGDMERRKRMFDRLQTITAEAEALAAQLEKAVSDSLRGAGLTTRQINARRGEAVEVWLAA